MEIEYKQYRRTQITIRRDGFVVGHSALYHDEPDFAESIEVDRHDIPDLVRSLMHACEREHIDLPVAWIPGENQHSVIESFSEKREREDLEKRITEKRSELEALEAQRKP